ncbi:hypothetical protein MCEMIEM12_00500 [Burkholderiaceae bacterium]|jgi:hypothetical protein
MHSLPRLSVTTRMVRCGVMGLLILGFATGSTAQLQTKPLENLGSLKANVTIPTCLPAGLSSDSSNLLVVNLPPLSANTLSDSNFGPVTPVEIDMRNEANAACLKPLRQNATLVFDQAFAAVAPNTGLLRNTARENPASNVYVQLGFFDATGLFTPLDLRQPFKLTPAMWRDSSTLMLGARYVAARAVTRQNPNQRTATTSGAAVTPGQVQVQLPFLMKVH